MDWLDHFLPATPPPGDQEWMSHFLPDLPDFSDVSFGSSTTAKRRPRIAGNIDLRNRPTVQNQDGTVSTVRSMSFGTDDGEVLVPTVSDDGRNLSPQEAFAAYQRTGKHLGIFDSPESATAYAKELHEQQAALLAKRAQLAATRALVAPEPGLTPPAVDPLQEPDPVGGRAFDRGIASGAKQGIDFLAHLPGTLGRTVAGAVILPIQVGEEEQRRRDVQASAEEGGATLEAYRRASAGMPPIVAATVASDDNRERLAQDQAAQLVLFSGLPAGVAGDATANAVEAKRQEFDVVRKYGDLGTGGRHESTPAVHELAPDQGLTDLGLPPIVEATFQESRDERERLKEQAATRAANQPPDWLDHFVPGASGALAYAIPQTIGNILDPTMLYGAAEAKATALSRRLAETGGEQVSKVAARDALLTPITSREIDAALARGAEPVSPGFGTSHDARTYGAWLDRAGLSPQDGASRELQDAFFEAHHPDVPVNAGPLTATEQAVIDARLTDPAVSPNNLRRPSTASYEPRPLAADSRTPESFGNNMTENFRPSAIESTFGGNNIPPPPPRIPLDAMPDPAAMPKPEFRQIVDLPPDVADAVHREGVTQAVDAGERVPPPVLKDYPDLSAEVALPPPRNPTLPTIGSPGERGFVKVPAGPKFLRRWFTAGGQFEALGEQKGWAFERSHVMEGAVGANKSRVRDNLRDFSSAFADDVVAAGHQDPGKVLDYITEGLQGGNDLSGISPKLRAAAEAMRDHLTEQSGGYLQRGDLPAALRQTIEQNRDTYFPRVHAAFHEPDWPTIVDPTSPKHDPSEAWRWDGFMDWAKEQRGEDQRAVYGGGRVRVDGADLTTPEPGSVHYGRVVRVGVDPREAMKEVKADPELANFPIPKGRPTGQELQADIKQATSADAVRLWNEARQGDRAFTQAPRELPAGYDVTVTGDHVVANTPAGEQRAFTATKAEGGTDKAHRDAKAWLRDQARAEPDPNALTEEALRGAGLGDKLPAREELRGIRNKEAVLRWDDQRGLPDPRAQAIAERKALRAQKFGAIQDREANNVLVAFEDGTSVMLPREKLMGVGGFSERTDEQLAGYGQKLLNKDPDAFLSLSRPVVGRESGGNLKRRLIMDPQVDDLPTDLAGLVRDGKLSLPGAIDQAKTQPGWWANYVGTAPGLPQELDDLLGLYRDPSVRYKVGAMRAGHDLAVHDFHQQLLERGDGTLFHEQPTQGAFSLIGGKGPLAERYASPEVAAVIRGTENTSRQAGALLNGWRKLNGAAKLGKTALNFPAGHMRNLAAWPFQLLAGGHLTSAFSPAEFLRLLPYEVADKLGTQRGVVARLGKRLADSVELADGTRLGERWSMDLDALRPEIGFLHEKGVLGESTHAADLQHYLGALSRKNEPAVISGTRRALKAPVDLGVKFWAGGDDLGKHVVYRANLHDLLWADAQGRFMGKAIHADYFTRPEMAAVAEEAARRTRLTTPSSSMIAPGIKALRDVPVAPFPGWTSEVFRNGKENVKLALSDLASSNPRMKVLGAKRLAGFLSAAALAGGGLAYGVRKAAGLSAEAVEAARAFVPPWSRDSQLAVMNVDKAGKVRYADLSALLPQAAYMDSAALILRAAQDPHDDHWDTAIDASQSLLGPYMEEEIVASTLLDWLRNKRTEEGSPVERVFQMARHHELPDQGYEVTTPGAHASTQVKQTLYHFWRGLGPSGLAGLQGERLARAIFKDNPDVRAYFATLTNYDKSLEIGDEGMAMAGLRVSTTDVSKAIARGGTDYTAQRGKASSLYFRRSRMGAEGVAQPEVVIAAKQEAEDMGRAAHEQLVSSIASALKLGYTDDQIRLWLKSGRVGKKHVGALIEDAQRFNAGFPATGSYIPVIQ